MVRHKIVSLLAGLFGASTLFWTAPAALAHGDTNVISETHINRCSDQDNENDDDSVSTFSRDNNGEDNDNMCHHKHHMRCPDGMGDSEEDDSATNNTWSESHSDRHKDCKKHEGGGGQVTPPPVAPPTGGAGNVNTTPQVLGASTTVGGGGAAVAAASTPTELPNTGVKASSSFWSDLAIIFFAAGSLYWRAMISPLARRK
jgi:hypothetical protein